MALISKRLAYQLAQRVATQHKLKKESESRKNFLALARLLNAEGYEIIFPLSKYYLLDGGGEEWNTVLRALLAYAEEVKAKSYENH